MKFPVNQQLHALPSQCSLALRHTSCSWLSFVITCRFISPAHHYMYSMYVPVLGLEYLKRAENYCNFVFLLFPLANVSQYLGHTIPVMRVMHPNLNPHFAYTTDSSTFLFINFDFQKRKLVLWAFMT